jgi:hypothetical protein
MRAGRIGLLAVACWWLVALSGCALTDSHGDADFPPATPPVASIRYKVTEPGQFPIDVYFAAWGEGYVIYAAGQSPIYLISDKKGGYFLQRPGDTTQFVVPRKDGSGWNILNPTSPATYLLKNRDDAGWTLQSPGDLPTLIQPIQPQ